MIKKRQLHLLFLMVVLLSLFISACGKDTTKTVVVQAASKTALLNPLQLQQFATPLPSIPVATPDTTTTPGFEYYVAVAEQATDYDFGLRKKDGSNFTNPVSGNPIRTTVWGYTVNGIKAGYLGATIEARSTLTGESGKQVKVKYVNNLKDSFGNLLTKHMLPIDPTIDGASQGEPEIRIATHLHGGHVPPEADGHPLCWVSNDPNALTGLPADIVNGRPARPNGNSITFTYPNDQQASQLWFHDHAMGVTRLNVYAGLAANYILRDSTEDSLNLPKGAYEIPLVIQDKSFHEDGSLAYASTPLLDATGEQIKVAGDDVETSRPEFFGNVIIVNGKAWPFLDVERRKYRFRMLNGSDSRFYNMWLERSDGGTIPAGAVTVIGNEAGLLPNAVDRIDAADPTTILGDSAAHGLLLATGERYDVIVDFSKFPAGTTLTLRNNAATPYPGGDPVEANTTGRIMQFKITKPLSGIDTSAVPATPLPRTALPSPSNTRVVDLQETEETSRFLYDPATGTILRRLKLLLNGRDFSDPITETPHLNAVEDWIIINTTVDMHPIHLHLVHFEVLEKGTVPASGYEVGTKTTMPSLTGALQPDIDDLGVAASPGSGYTVGLEELGAKETVRVPPGSLDGTRYGYVRVRARFDILGTYMWHCHILAHEEHEMMRPFTVIP